MQPELKDLRKWAEEFAPVGLVQAGWVLKLFDQMKVNEGGAETAIRYLELRCEAAEEKAESGQRFKDYVHGRLDAAGVPADPESKHKAEGCRIGGRLDELIGERDGLRKAIKDAGFAVMVAASGMSIHDVSEKAKYDEERTVEIIVRNIELEAEVKRLQAQIEGHVERITSQSDQLRKNAEKK